ncbi:MAG: hypothetical protein A2Z99_07620 [Treponema sp. GWB1_62_6]|nr:MAG: hypothetical protein A2Z99_07620 [Treponema sp. GWB1_62_6]OHE69864.1 MAG: hypothetical protein A2001_05235 [Treponema sp. GWC1_61_84]OHE76480.1 MAG: hypothetical protein A2413_05095 [Treponema sp. RIFOXYC1_FULL_61_9]
MWFAVSLAVAFGLLSLVLAAVLIRVSATGRAAYGGGRHRDFAARLAESERRMRLTLEATRIGTFDWDLGNDSWSASPTFYSMLGYEPIVGPADRREWLERVHPEEAAQVRERLLSVFDPDFDSMEFEARYAHADGGYRWERVSGYPVERGKDGRATRILGIRKNINDRKVAEEALRVSEKRLRSFFEDSAISIWEEDFSAVRERIEAVRATGVADWEAFFARRERVVEFASLVRILDVNRATVELLECDSKEEALRSLPVFYDEEAVATFRSELASLAAGRLSFECEAMLNTTTGRRVFLQLKLSVLPGHEENWSRVLVSMVDLSERKAAEEALQGSLREKELLLSEIHHRVKNNLQIICSLINLQLGGADEASGSVRSLRDMEARVRSMSFVHELLYQSDDFASVDFSRYVRQLCDYLMEAYGIDAGRVRVEIAVQDIRLSLDKAIPGGLIVNELFSNALKHAFPGDRSGTVRIGLKSADRGFVSLEVRDDGVGIAKTEREAKPCAELGSNLVESLAQQLNGSYRRETVGGVSVNIVFPA